MRTSTKIYFDIDRMSDAIRASGMTAQQIAEQIGAAYKALRIRLRDGIIKREELEAVCRVIGADVDYIIGEWAGIEVKGMRDL